MKNLSLVQSFSALGLKSNDTVMVHGDAGVAAQFSHIPSSDQLKNLIEELVLYFQNGTVIVPTFSYSFTKKETFNNNTTPSDIGLFSESFRLTGGVVRSCHPIFSVAAYGNHKDEFVETSITDCFGTNTFFDALRKKNAKLMCLGCSFDRVTFIHHVEQMQQIAYRYFKTFSGKVICNGEEKIVETRYFVRNLEIASESDLALLKQTCIQKNILRQSVIGRFPVMAIDSIDFFDVATALLKINPYALIKQRHLNS